ncbi:hypothetical protein CUMW_046480 [Citrus unshiu]|nr:hypothetical protein CUMW_046480 [Citrus unshiu]
MEWSRRRLPISPSFHGQLSQHMRRDVQNWTQENEIEDFLTDHLEVNSKLLFPVQCTNRNLRD